MYSCVFADQIVCVQCHLRMRDCARKALTSALLLVSHCSAIPTATLERDYRRESIGDLFELEGEDVNDVLLEEALMGLEVEETSDVKSVLSEIEQVGRMELAKKNDDEQEDEEELPVVTDPDLVNLTKPSTSSNQLDQSVKEKAP